MPWRNGQNGKIWNVHPLQLSPVPTDDPADWSLVHPAEAPFRLAPDLEALAPASDDPPDSGATLAPTAEPTPAP